MHPGFRVEVPWDQNIKRTIGPLLVKSRAHALPRQAGLREKLTATQACGSTARWSFPWRVPPLPCHHNSARVEPLPSHANLAQNISVFELAFGELEHGRIADRPDFQPSDVSAAKGRGRRGGARADNIDQLHSEAKKFRHGDQLVKSWPFDAERVNVTADDIRKKPCHQHCFGCAKAERAATVSDIENYPVPARLDHFLTDPSVTLDRRVGKRTEAMSQDVSPAQAREHIQPARWWVVEMRHDRKPSLFPNLARDIEGSHS